MSGELTSQAHWDASWGKPPRLRLPKAIEVGTRNLMRVLRSCIKPGDRVLEIGCAPGKMLAWVAHELGADVAGLDYSANGMRSSRALFAALDIPADLREENVFDSTFGSEFDVVYSAGVIEHFEDPTAIIARHLDLCKPGGRVLITVPNYADIYGRLQQYFDPQNLAIHNVRIMHPQALLDIAYTLGVPARAYHAGNMSPWLVNFDKRIPRRIALAFSLGLNAVALVQPFHVRALAPLVVLEMNKPID